MTMFDRAARRGGMRIRGSLALAPLTLVLGVAVTGGNALAQSRPGDAAAAWPERNVRVIIPYAPGGTADLLGRLIANTLQSTLKQAFVPENRAGGGGTIGSAFVAKAAPDGYTLVVSGIGSHVVAPVETKAYNPMTEFTHIALLGGPPTVLAVHPAVPANNVQQLIAWARQIKGGLSWGSPGQGMHGHLIGEFFGRSVGIDQTHISYKGAGPAVTDLLSGQIPVAFITFSSANQQIQAGKLRALAITTERRLPSLAEVPTFAELGYPTLTATTWFSISGPAGMAPAMVERINAEIRRGMKMPSAQKLIAQEGIETQDWDAATFTRFVRSEIERWSPLVKPADAK